MEWGKPRKSLDCRELGPHDYNWADAIAMNWTVILAVFLVVILVSVDSL